MTQQASEYLNHTKRQIKDGLYDLANCLDGTDQFYETMNALPLKLEGNELAVQWSRIYNDFMSCLHDIPLVLP